MDNNGFIAAILDRQACGKHSAPVGIPCFNIHTLSSSQVLSGICNKRARHAGFVGEISDGALRKTKRN